MKLVTTKNNKKKVNALFEWALHIFTYALILITVATIFENTIQIDNQYFGFWSLVASFIIYILNKTIKPLIIWLTLPLTALTLGLFYPFINVLILKIVSFILGDHFTTNGLFWIFLVAICISIMNVLMEQLVINPILEKEEK